jgi:glycosyltransferase involved in cell wall biosynthesis
LRWPGIALYRRLVNQCAAVIVHTATARDAICGTLGVAESKVTIVPHPGTPPSAASGPTPDELRARHGLGTLPVLLAFGFVHVDKGLDDLVAALGRLASAHDLPEVRLVVAGAVRPRVGLFRFFELRDRLYLARVRRMSRRLPGHTMVETGYVPDADVVGWFQAATAVVLPYRRNIDTSGPCSIAHALGTPVLASTTGGLREQCADSPWTFPPRDTRRLATVIARFLDAPLAAQAPVTGGTSAAEIEQVTAATMRVYQAATSAHVALTGSGRSRDAT